MKCPHVNQDGHVWVGITTPSLECLLCEVERLRADNAALKADVKAEREAFVLFCDQQAGGFLKIGSFGSAVEMQKALTVFSQSPTEKT